MDFRDEVLVVEGFKSHIQISDFLFLIGHAFCDVFLVWLFLKQPNLSTYYCIQAELKDPMLLLAALNGATISCLWTGLEQWRCPARENPILLHEA
jgi:hypothetical protein